jgi:coenzyme F420 hydrogenase subunit beta
LSKLAQGTEKDSTFEDLPKCYVGHSKNEGIRYNASSGGIATQLLVFALERGLIDGAIVTRMKCDNPLEPETIVARTREEIVSASKSKYCPTATNEAVKSILRQKGRYAVVGLPCQIHGIRKAEQNVKALKERIVLHVGLMCSHTVSFHGTDFLLRKTRLVPEQVASIDYRGLGWPGCMLITQRNGSKTLIPYVGKWNAYWPVFSSFFFTPKRCFMCPDETNELADIALGDAWLPELRKERNGESIIIARTKVGERILNLARLNDAIFLKRVDCNAVELSQAHPIKFKKADFGSRLSMMQSAGMKIPDYGFNRNPSSSFFSFARNLLLFFNVRMCENKTIGRFLVYVPFAVFRLYYGIYKFSLML